MKYRKIEPWKYKLVSDYARDIGSFPEFKHTYFFMSNDILSIRKGYAWDGPSGPAIDTKNAMIASLVHDTLYQAMNLGLLDKSYRKQADKVYRSISRAEGMIAFRAWYQYHAIRKFYPIWKKLAKPDYEKVYEVRIVT